MGFLKKIYKDFVIGDLKNTEDVPDVNAWMAYLDSMPMASEPVAMSYCKYLCRVWYVPKPKQVLLNAVAFLALLAACPRLVKSGQTAPVADADRLVVIKSKDVPYEDVIPAELVSRFEEKDFCDSPTYKAGDLTERGRSMFAKCVKAHPFSFYYLYYVLKELSLHSSLVRSKNPRAVAVYVNERNFAGPILRCAYEDGGREFDSFMHGEYLLQLIQGYMSFSNFYVWDDSYKDMFENTLRCDFGSCVTYQPAKLAKKWHLEDVKPDHFLTYYFSGESAESLARLSVALEQLEAHGMKCLVRPHPRYSHTDLIERYFHGRIEDPKAVQLEQSLGAAQYACGINSTVLFEARAEGREIILDDVSNPAAYENLGARKFRLISEGCDRLSSFFNRDA